MIFTPTLALLTLEPVANDAAADITTHKEYEARLRAARARAARMDQAARRQLIDVYLEAAKEAAAVVERSLERGLSSLTVARWQALERELKAAADSIALGTETVARALVGQAAPLFPEIDADFIYGSARKAGAEKLITRKGLERLIASTSSQVVASLSSRLWSDGQTFSERVWGGAGVRGDWLERIRMTVAAGIAQGRDPVKIARDIQVYTAGGKIALAQRWGGLKRGTGEFSKRLPSRLDYRAVRLVRSELYASLQDAAVLSGEANPGGNGLYDWVLSIGREAWPCECADLASSGPYTKDALPTYPHPNCMCSVQPHLRDQAVFLADLKRWAKGEDVDYLDSWYAGPYRAAAA
jgi:hypothetical protein